MFQEKAVVECKINFCYEFDIWYTYYACSAHAFKRIYNFSFCS